MNKNKIQCIFLSTCIVTSFFVTRYFHNLDIKKQNELEIQKKIIKEINFEDLNYHVIEYLEKK